MGFLSDLGGFLSEVQHVSDELTTAKQEVFSIAKDAVMNVEAQGKEVAADIQTNSQTIARSVKTTTDDMRSQLNN